MRDIAPTFGIKPADVRVDLLVAVLEGCDGAHFSFDMTIEFSIEINLDWIDDDAGEGE